MASSWMPMELSVVPPSLNWIVPVGAHVRLEVAVAVNVTGCPVVWLLALLVTVTVGVTHIGDAVFISAMVFVFAGSFFVLPIKSVR